jgi:hypothetical protein
MKLMPLWVEISPFKSYIHIKFFEAAFLHQIRFGHLNSSETSSKLCDQENLKQFKWDMA